MIRAAVRESSYGFRATFRHRWTGYLTLVVLIGLVGGVAMAALAGARRTQSSFSTYLASTNPSDAQLFTNFVPISGTGYSARVNRAVARVPGVEQAVPVIGFDGTLQVLGKSIVPRIPGEAPPSVEGSPNGEYLTTDRVTLLAGRMANPKIPDELMLTSGAATSFGLHLGSRLPVAFFTAAQEKAPGFAGYPEDPPHLIVSFKLVGLIAYASQVVVDNNQRLSDQLAVVTPALTRQLKSCCAYYSYESLHLRWGPRQQAAIVSAVEKVVPNLGPVGGSTTWAPVAAKADRAIRPESIAIGVFGLIAALAALVIGGQAISRLVRQNIPESAVVRSLGATPAMVMADVLGGILAALIVGSLAAVGVAIALSPLAPLGPVRTVYPYIGVSFDWTVFGFGLLLFTVVLAGAAVFVAYRVAPHRLARRVARTDRDPGWNRAATAAGLPASAVIGIGSALGARSGRDAAPVRSALLGAVVAVTVIVTSLTFASSLGALVSQPALYGWTWNYALLAGFSAEENLPAAQTAALLDQDPYVAHWAGAYFESVNLDGPSVPVLAMHPKAAVGPSLLSGHEVTSQSQIVLGPATLASLHAHLGDSVTAALDGHRRVSLRIVGTATLPTLGGSGPGGLEMGTGAVMATSLFSATDLNQQGSPINGPMADLITVRPDANQAAALTSLNGVTTVLDRRSDPDGPVGGVVSHAAAGRNL